MYIKSIKAQGFKSFADKLELDFSKGINAIVGPNGSGKSNVVDAILWVLGEQSVKSLRGDSQMSDVIFSGSKTRAEQKKASVAILFDNTDKMLPTEFSEVEIKRVIYKTGENEYFINGAHVRLKDITDLLMDVTSKFNIITQGNINALVENKSSERRVLFESAAGVLKYKKRKEESLKKLEGTKENLTRVNLIIKELNTSLEPLEKQKDDAEKYLKIKKELEETEIALIAKDIESITEKYNNYKKENTLLQKELSSLTISHPIGLEKLKLESIKLDENISNANQKLMSLTSQIADLNSEKQITIERTKYEVDGKTINTNLLSLKEKILDIQKNISVMEDDISTLKNNLQTLVKEQNTISDEALKLKVKLSNNESMASEIQKSLFSYENKIKIEKANLESNSYLPKSVSNILNNPKLKGIHNIIGALYKAKMEHELAISTALGAATNFIVVDNLNGAKEAINYLKNAKLGRATFFPLDTIASRYIVGDVLNKAKTSKGFIGVASDLIEYDKKYQAIMENQLGNVLVMQNMDDMFNLAKMLDYKYKMVSLDGEILFPGGSVAGGESSTKFGKSNLAKLNREYEDKKLELESLNITLKTDEEALNNNRSALDSINQKISEKRFIIETKENALLKLKEEEKEANLSIKGLEDMENGSLDRALETLLQTLASKEKEKEICENEIKDLQSKKFDITGEIESLEKKMQEQNSSYHKLENQINTNEVEIGKAEVKIDNLLNTLTSDYNMSYENALNNYTLKIDEDLARNIVSKLKNELKKLPTVNLGSIAEYERLKKRYDFLDKQKNDLEESSAELLDIIAEMDETMKDKFKTTFEKISGEFSKVFRIMFKGGNGLLKLDNEEDLLNTNINILAVPPGKKLNSTAFLSGGEKALTAICLIFAILNVKPVPFIVLDEAEAALDEENVNMFGEYLENMKKQSQFILITHKKKMMEYADILYGITMQESGVSNRVSVKLEEY